MQHVQALKCKECGKRYPTEPMHVCEFCFGPLEAEYDYEYIAQRVSRESIAAGPLSVWRYRDLLPVEGDDLVDLGAGMTPLMKAERLGQELGLNQLYIKNDTTNPTWSFKDRVVTVALTRAREFGMDTVACASTGNLGNAVSAHAARAGFRAFVFIPADLELGKVVGSLIYGPNLVKVNGNYDEVNRLCSEIADRYPWAFVNINVRPYYSEGSKTLAFETAEQLGWRAPDHVVVPIASGSQLTKIHKGFQELQRVGLIDEHHVHVHGAQAEGCSPVVRAFEQGADFVAPVRPDTIAKSLAIGNPADGYYACSLVRQTEAQAVAVTDDEIVAAMKLLAETEGVFAETAGGVTIGVLRKLAEGGFLGADETVVAYVTGCGLKTQEAVTGHLEIPLEIGPSLAEFEQASGISPENGG